MILWNPHRRIKPPARQNPLAVKSSRLATCRQANLQAGFTGWRFLKSPRASVHPGGRKDFIHPVPADQRHVREVGFGHVQDKRVAIRDAVEEVLKDRLRRRVLRAAQRKGVSAGLMQPGLEKGRSLGAPGATFQSRCPPPRFAGSAEPGLGPLRAGLLKLGRSFERRDRQSVVRKTVSGTAPTSCICPAPSSSRRGNT